MERRLFYLGLVLLFVSSSKTAHEKINTPIRHSNHNVFDFSHEDYLAEPSSVPLSSTSTHQAGSQLLSVLHLLRTFIVFLAIPFQLLYRLLLSLVVRLYFFLRFSLSHTLRTVVIVLAPLTYFLSGITYIFFTAPYRVLFAIASQLYPLYVFLGAAAVVGITMGLAAALVLYATAFFFIDKVEKDELETEKIQVRRRYERKSWERPSSAVAPQHSYYAP